MEVIGILIIILIVWWFWHMLSDGEED